MKTMIKHLPEPNNSLPAMLEAPITLEKKRKVFRRHMTQCIHLSRRCECSGDMENSCSALSVVKEYVENIPGTSQHQSQEVCFHLPKCMKRCEIMSKIIGRELTALK